MAYNEGASSGNLVLIESQTASNDADIEFTSGISGYDLYYLSFYDVIIQNDGSLLVHYSNDGGSTWIVTDYLTEGPQSRAGGGIGNLDTGFGGVLLINSQSNFSNRAAAGNCIFYGLKNPSIEKYAFANTSAYVVGAFTAFSISTAQASTTIVNSLRVICDGGNILSGTFKLYGIQN